MKIHGIVSAVVLTVSAALSAPAFACSSGEISGGILFSQPNQNENLSCGEYEFAGVNSLFNSSFNDRWKFTVSEDTIASISVFDMELGLDSPENELPTAANKHSKSFQHVDTTKIFDTKNLSFTLFDNETGQFLGWAGENETLSGLSLVAGRLYTLKVYGDVGGIFGSAYHGTLETCVTQVPLSDTAPLLGSALGLLALRLRKRATTGTNA